MMDMRDAIIWRPMIEFDEAADHWVLLQDRTGRQHYGGRKLGAWYEFVDGQRTVLRGFEPIRWAEAPGGPEAWA